MVSQVAHNHPPLCLAGSNPASANFRALAQLSIAAGSGPTTSAFDVARGVAVALLTVTESARIQIPPSQPL